MALPLTLDPRLQRTIDEFALESIDARIAEDLRLLGTLRPDSRIFQRCKKDLEERVGRYQAYHETDPFRVMPPAASVGELVFGVQPNNGVQIRRPADANTGIFGLTGSGKTTIVLNLLPQLQALGIKLVILDPKGDYHRWAVENPDCYIIDGQAPVALLEIPPFLSKSELLAAFEARWSRALFSHEHGRQVLYEAFAKLVFPASLFDYQEAVESLFQKTDTYARRDAIRGVSMRLQRIADLYPVPFRTRVGVPLSALFDHSVLFPAPTLTDVAEFLFSYYVALLTLRNRRQA